MFSSYRIIYFLSISRFHAEISGNCRYQGNWQTYKNACVTSVVFLLTGMDESLPHFAFYIRFYSFIHIDRMDY